LINVEGAGTVFFVVSLTILPPVADRERGRKKEEGKEEISLTILVQLRKRKNENKKVNSH
jgi:hypothetical protein